MLQNPENWHLEINEVIVFVMATPNRFILFFVSCWVLAPWALAQDELSAQYFVNMQSKDIELPEDFMARVDGNKLQVTLAALGAVESQPSTASLLVRLLNSKGDERVAVANSNGVAEFENVNANELHALLVADETSHAAIPIMTVSSMDADRRGLTSKNVKLPLMPANRREILASINRDILPPTGPAGELYGTSDYRAEKTNPYRVRLQSDGRLLGRVIVADRDLVERLRYAKLTFLRNNQVITRVDSDPDDGSFVVPSLAPGVYGVIAAGPAGYSSFAFDVLPATARRVTVRNPNREIQVSMVQSDSSNQLYVFLCPPKLVPAITDRIREVYRQPSSDAAGAVAPDGS
ncbi:MAG: hypothetical protein ABL921_13035, partial [Pirellula sp.]